MEGKIPITVGMKLFMQSSGMTCGSSWVTVVSDGEEFFSTSCGHEHSRGWINWEETRKGERDTMSNSNEFPVMLGQWVFIVPTRPGYDKCTGWKQPDKIEENSDGSKHYWFEPCQHYHNSWIDWTRTKRGPSASELAVLKGTSYPNRPITGEVIHTSYIDDIGTAPVLLDWSFLQKRAGNRFDTTSKIRDILGDKKMTWKNTHTELHTNGEKVYEISHAEQWGEVRIIDGKPHVRSTWNLTENKEGDLVPQSTGVFRAVVSAVEDGTIMRSDFGNPMGTVVIDGKAVSYYRATINSQ